MYRHFLLNCFVYFGNWYHFCIESCAKRLLSRLLNDFKQLNDSLIETQLLLDEAKSIHLWNSIIAIIFIGNASNTKFAMANVSSFILIEMTEYGKMCIIIKIIMENFRRVLFLYDCTNCTLYWSYACPNLVNNSLMLSRIWNRWTWLLVHETLRMKMDPHAMSSIWICFCLMKIQKSASYALKKIQILELWMTWNERSIPFVNSSK